MSGRGDTPRCRRAIRRACGVCSARSSGGRLAPMPRAAPKGDSSRARTSPLRLVSCVESVSIASGHRSAASAIARWKSSTGLPNSRRIAADLVERDEPMVTVECRVLHALGHDRRAQLREAQCEIDLVVPRVRKDEQLADEVQELRFQIRTALFGAENGRPDIGAVGIADPCRPAERRCDRRGKRRSLRAARLADLDGCDRDGAGSPGRCPPSSAVRRSTSAASSCVMICSLASWAIAGSRRSRR